MAPADDDETTPSIPQPFVRGGNLPWVNAGWDFGVSPYDLTTPAKIKRNFNEPLEILKHSGVSVVRVFIIGQGLSYVSNISHPSAMQQCCDTVDIVTPMYPPLTYFTLKDEATLPPLPTGYVEDFIDLCKLVHSKGMKIMPTFLSFEFFSPYGGGGRRGRTALVFGNDALPEVTYRSGILPFERWPEFRSRPSTTEAKRRQVRRFLAATLEPLLHALNDSPEAKSAIFAWDVCNEPDWVVDEYAHLSDPFMAQEGHYRTIPTNDMCLLLGAAVRRVARSGMNVTIGFAEIEPDWVPRWFTSQIRNIATSNNVQYFHQGHYYPRTSAAIPRMKPVSSLDERFRQFPCIVGEFPTRWPSAGPNDLRDRMVCPEWMDGASSLPHEGDANRYLYHRIRRIEALGYQGAFFWSLNARDAQSAPTGGDSERQSMLNQLRWAAGLPPVTP